MLDVAASLALTFLIAYPSLWAQSFDPNFIVEIYGQHDLNGPSNFLTDEDPPLFSLGAAGWTCALFVASSESETHCSLNMSNLSSIDGLVGVLAVAVTGKCLIGSAGVTHKRMLLGSNGKLTRPFSWRLLDVISPIPTNLSVKVFNKLVWFPVFAGVSWVFDLFASEKLTDKLIIPDYAFLALAFLFIGRLSTIYQHREQLSFAEHIGLRARKRWNGWALTLMLLACMASYFLTYALIEKLLGNCGATSNSLPSLLPLLLGILAAPAFSLLLAAVAGAFAHLFSSRS